MGSKCRQNFHKECELFVNKIINLQLYAGNCYLSLGAHFDRDDVALPGFAQYFYKCGRKEHHKTKELLDYQNLRGGHVIMQPVDRPTEHEWDTPLKAVQFALKLEKQMNEALINLHGLANSHHDPHLSDYLKDEFINERAEVINRLARYVTNLERVGDGLGVYIMDKDLQ